MPLFRRTLALAVAVTALGLAGDVGAAVQAPRIGKPRPAPVAPSTMPPLPPATFDDQLAVGGDDIRARKVETRLSVDVRVNGRGPYPFVVDSGADTSVVGLRIARDLQLPLGTPVVLNGMTARHIVDRVRVGELTFGPSTIKDLELPALREQDVGGAGMIGIDALKRQRLLLDFEKKLIKVEDARIPYKAMPGEIVITARRKRGQLILTEVKAGGLRLDAVIDTGTQVTIGNLALRDKLVGRNPARLWTVAATGVTGSTVDLQLAEIPELRLGPVTLRNVPIAFADVPPFTVFGLDDGPALLLGTDILENFRRISLDFESRKVRFQLRRCGTEGITIATSPTLAVTRISSNNSVEVCGR